LVKWFPKPSDHISGTSVTVNEEFLIILAKTSPHLANSNYRLEIKDRGERGCPHPPFAVQRGIFSSFAPLREASLIFGEIRVAAFRFPYFA